MLIMTTSFSESLVFKMFSVLGETQSQEGCFRKALFSWRISVDGRPNLRFKAAFSNFFPRSVDLR